MILDVSLRTARAREAEGKVLKTKTGPEITRRPPTETNNRRHWKLERPETDVGGEKRAPGKKDIKVAIKIREKEGK